MSTTKSPQKQQSDKASTQIPRTNWKKTTKQTLQTNHNRNRTQQKGVGSINILYKRQFTEQKWINQIERADFLRVRTLKRRMGDTF